MVGSEHLTEGLEAYERCAWADAYDHLAHAATESDPGTAGLERLAVAAYLTGRDEQSADAWRRAHRACLDAHDPERAVLCAFWLAFGLIQRGEMSQGAGWLARAGHLVEDRGLDCVGCGYLLVPAALMHLDRGAHQDAYDEFESAGSAAERFGDVDLLALSRLGRGQSLYCMGRASDGSIWFDEVMVSVTGGEVSPVVSGIVYCAVIDECQRAFDVKRARAWTRALDRWCDSQPTMVPYRGQCLVHRSQILQLHGAWDLALDEAVRAEQRLSEPSHPAIGMAHYQLGELQRLRGDLDAAEASYLLAQECGRSPQPGLSLARLAQGDTAAAAAMIDGALAETDDAVARAQRLPAFVEIMLIAGRVDEARRGSDELTAISREHDTPFLDAAAAYAEGAVLMAQGEHRGALTPLRHAWRLWKQLETPYEGARSQVLIASACRSLGDLHTARIELDGARRTLVQLGATGTLEQLDEPSGKDSTSGPVLSPRELQVLRRVARGMTNREIADDLIVSVKTVERHLSNVFVKLDVPNRAAAIAAVYDSDLL